MGELADAANPRVPKDGEFRATAGRKVIATSKRHEAAIEALFKTLASFQLRLRL